MSGEAAWFNLRALFYGNRSSLVRYHHHVIGALAGHPLADSRRVPFHDDYHVVHVLVVLTHGISAELEAFSEASKLAISRAGAKRLARQLLCQSTTPPYVSRTSTVTHLRSPQLQSRDPQAHHRGWCIT